MAQWIQFGDRGAIGLTDNQHKALGIDSLMFLGKDDPACGSYACVYNSKDPKWIVKITGDEEDATGFAKAKGSEFVARTREIYRLTGLGHPETGRPMYGLVVERVDPIVGKESLFINMVLWSSAGSLNQSGLFDGYEEGKKFTVAPKIRSMIEPQCRRIVKTAMGRGDKRFVSEDSETEACRLLINQTVDAVEDLANRGVQFTDNHAGNWGRRKNGRLVAIDLGLSSPPWGAPNPKIPRLDGNRGRARGEFITKPWPPWRR